MDSIRAFAALLWESSSGEVACVHLAEALQLGIQLKRLHPRIERYLFCTAAVYYSKGWRMLAGVWKVTLIEHLETGRRGCGDRLKKVWTKFKVWDPASYGLQHPDVVVLLDTDVSCGRFV